MAADYDPARALFPAAVLDFVKKTQARFWERLEGLNQGKAEAVLLDSLVKELDSKGLLAVLREGFKCFGKTVRLAYFAPNTGMDPAAAERYGDNRLMAVRQVQTASGAIPDMVLALNGLPVATLELKNPMTGQRLEHAKRQYRFERDPKELLFAFKRRCLVHFAVDTEEVVMTTKLEGKDTVFLPFNRGHGGGAGNRPRRDRRNTSSTPCSAATCTPNSASTRSASTRSARRTAMAPRATSGCSRTSWPWKTWARNGTRTSATACASTATRAAACGPSR